MPSSNTVAYNASSTQLHNFGDTLLPKVSKSIVEPSLTKQEVVTLKRDIAWNNKISALWFEEHDKGLIPDYNAIKARVLQEDESLPIDKIGKQKYGFTTLHTHLLLHHIIHPLHNCKVLATPVCHCRKNLKALGGNHIRSGLNWEKA